MYQDVIQGNSVACVEDKPIIQDSVSYTHLDVYKRQALDNIGWKEIVGCIAGDDTIMCAIRTMEEAQTCLLYTSRCV